MTTNNAGLQQALMMAASALSRQGYPVDNMSSDQIMSAYANQSRVSPMQAGVNGPNQTGQVFPIPQAQPRAAGMSPVTPPGYSPRPRPAGPVNPIPNYSPRPRPAGPVNAPSQAAAPVRTVNSPAPLPGWGRPGTMPSASLGVAAVSPSATGNPRVARALAEERARRGMAPESQPPLPTSNQVGEMAQFRPMARPNPQAVPPSSPPQARNPALGMPKELRIPDDPAAATAQREQVKSAVTSAYGEEEANSVDGAPAWAVPLMAFGLGMLTNSDRPFGEAVGISGLGAMQVAFSEDQRRKDNEARDRQQEREDRRVEGDLSIRRDRLGLDGRKMNNDLAIANARLGLSAEQVALQRDDLQLKRLNMDRDFALAKERLGLDAASTFSQIDHNNWERAFADKKLGTEMEQFRNNLELRYANLGLDAKKADDNANYLAALVTQMGDSTTLSYMSHLLDRAKLDSANSQFYDSMIADAITDLVTNEDPYTSTPESTQEKVNMLVEQLRTNIPRRVSIDELE